MGDTIVGTERPQGLLQRLMALEPKHDVVFTAIEQLKDETEIRQFFQEYVKYIEESGLEDSPIKDPKVVANMNIGYVLGYYEKAAGLWRKALPDAKHPVYGSNIPWNDPKKAVEASDKHIASLTPKQI